MSVPLFVKIQDTLVNLSNCNSVRVEGETVVFETNEDSIDFEYEDEKEAQAAMRGLQQLLTTKNLLIGSAD